MCGGGRLCLGNPEHAHTVWPPALSVHDQDRQREEDTAWLCAVHKADAAAAAAAAACGCRLSRGR